MALKEENNTLVVERDRAVRVIGTGMGLFVLLAPLGIALLLPPGRMQTPEVKGFLVVLALVCLLLALLMLWTGGPYRLSLDFAARTYRVLTGLPLLAKERSGPFTHIREVYVSMSPTKTGTRYQVSLGWNVPGPDAGLLVLWDEAEAFREADRIAARLGVPVSDGVRGKVTRFRVGNVRTPFGMAVSVAVWLGLGGFFLALGLPGLFRELALDSRGRETPGRILSASRSGRKVLYRYRVGGREYLASCPVTQADAEAVHGGEVVAVRYLPDDPQTSRLPNSFAKRQLWTNVGLGTLMLLLMPIDWVSNERQKRQQGLTF